MKTLSLDLRERIVAAYDRGDGTRLEIARRYNVSESMVKKLLKQRVKTGDIGDRHANSGRKPTITPVHQKRLRKLVKAQPDATLAELRDTLGLGVTPQAIHYALERMGLPLKKKTLRPAELDRPDIRMARVRWAKAKKHIDHGRLLFVDESGAKTNMTRRYGRAPRGMRAYDRVPHGRWETTTMIAAMGRNGPQAPWVLDGPMDGSAFAVWAQQVLAPTLVPGDIIVLDNLAAHRNAEAVAAINAQGAAVWYLPPYSPDLNPIEKMWSKIKTMLRTAKARDDQALFDAIGNAFAGVSQSDIVNWFASCGYIFI